MFKYTKPEIRKETLDNEHILFVQYIIENIIALILQSIGMLFCLNIGFLYFNYKVRIGEIISLIVKSYVAVILVHILIILIIKLNDMIFTVGSLNSINEKFSLSYYVDTEKIAPWLGLSLTTINLVQLLTVIILSISVYKQVKIKYKKALSITLRTYGVGFLLWFVFAMVMEMNFS